MTERRCPYTGMPCPCNNVEAFVNCPHKPEYPNVDPDFDVFGHTTGPDLVVDADHDMDC